MPQRKQLSVEEYAEIVRKALKDAGKPLNGGELVRVVARRAGAKNPDNYSGITQLTRLDQALKTVLKGEVSASKEGTRMLFSLGKGGARPLAAKLAKAGSKKQAVATSSAGGRKGRPRKDAGTTVSFAPFLQFVKRVQRQLAEGGKDAAKAVERVLASADKVSDEVKDLRDKMKGLEERYEPMYRAFVQMSEQVQSAETAQQ